MNKLGMPLAIIAALALLAGCAKPLTPETVSARLKNGSYVTDRTKVCTLQETLQVRPGIAVEYNGKTYHQ